MKNLIRSALAGAAMVLSAGTTASAAVYDFDFNVDTVNVTGFIEIDETSANYTGGGTTNKDDITDFLFKFTKGGNVFTGDPTNTTGIQTADLTYSADLLSIPTWDISIGFRKGSVFLGFAGNNFSSDFAQVVDFDDRTFNAETQQGPDLNAQLRVTAVPLPAGLPLLLAGLGGLALLRRRA